MYATSQNERAAIPVPNHPSLKKIGEGDVNPLGPIPTLPRVRWGTMTASLEGHAGDPIDTPAPGYHLISSPVRNSPLNPPWAWRDRSNQLKIPSLEGLRRSVFITSRESAIPFLLTRDLRSSLTSDSSSPQIGTSSLLRNIATLSYCLSYEATTQLEHSCQVIFPHRIALAQLVA